MPFVTSFRYSFTTNTRGWCRDRRAEYNVELLSVYTYTWRIPWISSRRIFHHDQTRFPISTGLWCIGKLSLRRVSINETFTLFFRHLKFFNLNVRMTYLSFDEFSCPWHLFWFSQRIWWTRFILSWHSSYNRQDIKGFIDPTKICSDEIR